jgi:GWxTD domain-containing protein
MHRIFSVILLAALAAAAQAQTDVIPGRGVFRIEMDEARFSAQQGETYLEVYYGVPEVSLAYRPDSGAYRGGIRMTLEVRSESSLVASKEWAVPHVLGDTALLARGQSLMGLVSVALPRGMYRLRLLAADLEAPSRRDSISTPLAVPGFDEDRPSVSDIELASNIVPSQNTASVFYKNTLEVIPNASRTYGAGLPILQWYAEVYNLAKTTGNEPVVLKASVINGAGKEVRAQTRAKSRQYNSTVEAGTMNLSGIPGGSYRLRLTVTDTARTPARTLASAEKKFFIYRIGGGTDSTITTETGGDVAGDYAFMTEEEIAQHFARAKYIAGELEIRQFEAMTDLKGRQNFMADFWRRRDTDPTTAVNEFKRTFDARVAYANEHLSNRFNDGWKSDRGRVYIVYGPADEVERVPSSAESLPYEVWHYNNLQGGVIFVFVDRNNFGAYTLVHSTHRDELHNENWLQEHARRTN